MSLEWFFVCLFVVVFIVFDVAVVGTFLELEAGSTWPEIKALANNNR